MNPNLGEYGYKLVVLLLGQITNKNSLGKEDIFCSVFQRVHYGGEAMEEKLTSQCTAEWNRKGKAKV